jgi:uncharacterized protein YutE (UPF0331/DUF86 family)
MSHHILLRNDAIRVKLAIITDSIKLVESHLPSDVEEFTKLGLVKDGIYKRVEYAIENVLDICAMINADMRLGIPESDEDIILSLVNNSIIDLSIGEEIKQMKKFRNIVVHRYGKIDDIIAYEILSEQLSSFNRFSSCISQFLNENG